MPSTFLKTILSYLKKKVDFSFLNAAGILLLAAVIFIPLSIKYSLEDTLKNEVSSVDTNGYRNLTYIKPFTSLVGFNWKFNKENKQKQKKAVAFGIPAINF